MLGKALTGIAALSIGACFSVAQARDLKLYAFSSGALTIGKGALVNNAPDPPIQVPVGFYVIRHPKETCCSIPASLTTRSSRIELLGAPPSAP
ncbi:MAG: hypothetical protein U1E60_08870 [Reyranellaceae bacterium]